MTLQTDLNILRNFKSAARPLATKAAVCRRTAQIAAQARTLADVMDADGNKLDGPTVLRKFAAFLEENGSVS